ncbi:hypothetical protein [Paenilisteria weihenstephanensis]|nr:hypothetical protein [Listeria weihenstephanensis]
MKKREKFGLKILSAAMIVALIVPSSIENIATSADTGATVKTEQASEKKV